MRLSLFWKLMLAFTLVVAIGLGAVVILANQITSRELHQFMMGSNGQGMMGPGQSMMGASGPDFLQQTVIDRVNGAVVIGGLLALAAAIIVGYFVFRSITRPIEQLTAAAHQLAQGDLGTRVTVDDRPARLGPDEISELGAAFNTMADHLQEADQIQRDMTADIAHELRTPLAVMRGILEAMHDGVYPLDVEHLDPVLNQVKLLSRLVDDLRTLALAEAGHMPLVKRPTDLRALIENTLTSFEAQAAIQQVVLKSGGASSLPTIDLDPDRIQQAIGILISNALRYTPPHGSITIATQAEKDNVLIEVSDTGSGIAPEDLSRVFERFYRADKSRARESGGSGLGLAIAKSIVEAHGGTLLVTSELDKGTTLLMKLPVQAADTSTIPQPRQPLGAGKRGSHEVAG